MDATHIQRIKGPMPQPGQQRVLWIVYAAPEGNERAQIVDIVEAVEQPTQYMHLCQLPTIATHASGFNTWLLYAEQHLDTAPKDA